MMCKIFKLNRSAAKSPDIEYSDHSTHPRNLISVSMGDLCVANIRA